MLRYAEGMATSTIETYFRTQGFLETLPSQFCFCNNETMLLFVRSDPGSVYKKLYCLDLNSGEERCLFDPQTLESGASQMTEEEKNRRERLRISSKGVTSFVSSPDGKSVLVPLLGDLYRVEVYSGVVKRLAVPPGAVDPRFSPDGKSLAYVRGSHVYVFMPETGQEICLTEKGPAHCSFGLAEFIAQEEMGRFEGMAWSPDSKSLAVCAVDNRPVEVFTLSDLFHPEAPASTFAYPRPGKENARVSLAIFDVETRTPRWIDWGAKQFPYLATLRWQDTGPLTLVVQDRLQRTLRVLALNEQTGDVQVLLQETDAAWINLDQSVPHWTPHGFLWSTEREGAWQLELRSATGALKAVCFPKEFGYLQLVAVCADQTTAFVAAATNPTERHIYRLDLVTGTLQRWSEGAGRHHVVVSPSGDRWVHHCETLEQFPSVSMEGTTKSYRWQAEPAYKIQTPQVAQVGKRSCYSAVVLPQAMQKGEKYPVVVHCYGGPKYNHVVASQRRFFLDQWLADQGFVVVSIDGRGTPGRGRSWERSIAGNFADVIVQDQVDTLVALGEKHPEMDLQRVGIHGWSFGGYLAALAVLRRPDVFRAGVAGAPVVDWRDYDTHYTERYLGLPQDNPQGYEESSLLSYVDRLERPLLLMHGTADDNVYFLHSLRLSQQLFLAGKTHDFLPLPGVSHFLPDPLSQVRKWERLCSFFKKHLAK